MLRSLILGAGLLAALASVALAGPSLLFDPRTGEVLSQERAGEPWYPASLTKLMTAYLVFQKIKAGELSLDQKIKMSEVAAKQPPSKLGVRAGGEITVDTALQAMLVYSANDIAVALAEAAGGTLDQFVRQMNLAAHGLGMTGTYFANPNGLFDPRQVTTARDIALLVRALVTEFPEHKHYYAQPHLVVGKRRLPNRNSLIRQMKTADGMKTGFICNSGYNLVASATEEGRQLVAVILGARSGRERVEIAEMLLRSGFSRPSEPARPRLETLASADLGALVPADLTATVCKGKPAFAIADATNLEGWGISFGQYATAQLANMALRGRILAARDFIEQGSAGVIKIAGSSAYSAMVWRLEERTSTALCAYITKTGAHCDVVPPENLARMAAGAAAEAKPASQPVAQGSDDPRPKKKRKKRRR